MFDQNANPSETELNTTPIAFSPPARDPRYDTADGRLFRKALSFIEDPTHWCVGLLAHTSVLGDKQYCALGAIGMAYNGNYFSARDGAAPQSVIQALAKTMGGTCEISPHANIARFNNSHTHAENMAAWRKCGKDNGWL